MIKMLFYWMNLLEHWMHKHDCLCRNGFYKYGEILRKRFSLSHMILNEAIFLSDEIYILTPRPGTIKEKVSIHLPRPRTEQTLLDPACFSNPSNPYLSNKGKALWIASFFGTPFTSNPKITLWRIFLHGRSKSFWSI